MKNLEQLKNEFANLSEFLIAIGDETRQAIIIALLEDNACNGLRVNDLTEVTDLSRPAISHHLKVLKQAHLVDFRREGTKNYYYLSHNISEIEQLRQLLTHVSDIIDKEQ
ncbi:winged helix-turn-helix transcriptional regulator [Pediococcus stilesii]|uniref:Winged helix-turn-helix transcriptional regulator n=1 Tax=Pediococcus stilesii TaxID=331679 RepID=A0A5R9BYH1_9LACO|nr:metalloregulator ArsR/SmtB family transcription factor [Pediococcus stilesii]TLQ05090.1 winged helix-turn-helix transcriptional regulator [Pediococcus stilesii]